MGGFTKFSCIMHQLDRNISSYNRLYISIRVIRLNYPLELSCELGFLYQLIHGLNWVDSC